MKRSICALSGILALTLAISCAREGAVTPVVVLAVGDVQVKALEGEYTPAKVSRVIVKGDVIKTGPLSHVTIQMGERGIVQVLPNSSIEAVTLFESGESELNLFHGTVLSRIDKLGKSEDFRVKTPTAIAAVRGTIFSVSYDRGTGTVGVSRGRVEVTETVSGKAGEVTQGKAVDVKAGITARGLTKTESLVLSKAEAVNYIEGIRTMAPGALEEKGKSFLPALEKIDEEIKDPPPATMEEIKAKYGRIDVVTLYSGKVYRGAIISRGAILRIRTTEGTVEVPNEKVKSTVTQ
ncbi:MAG: hypothetical protein EPN93_06925 [Spirochaetes bacterium]|nr:MAG: hypothetical protein EPN93_06925 [Spirochaetota bacterium]